MKVTINPIEPATESAESLFAAELERNRSRPNPLAVVGSIGFHVGGLALLVLIGSLPTTPTPPQDLIAPPRPNEKVIWYFTKDQLPQVASEDQPKVGKPKVELKRSSQLLTAEAPKPGK